METAVAAVTGEPRLRQFEGPLKLQGQLPTLVIDQDDRHIAMFTAGRTIRHLLPPQLRGVTQADERYLSN